MSGRRWKVRAIIKEATIEVAFLFENENVKDEVNRILKILASQDDPRVPSIASNLDVSELYNDAPDWYRVKVGRYGIRLIFRILIVRNKKIVEVSHHAPLPEHQEGDQSYIEIMQAGYRKDVYGDELRQRYWRYGTNDN